MDENLQKWRLYTHASLLQLLLMMPFFPQFFNILQKEKKTMFNLQYKPFSTYVMINLQYIILKYTTAVVSNLEYAFPWEYTADQFGMNKNNIGNDRKHTKKIVQFRIKERVI